MTITTSTTPMTDDSALDARAHLGLSRGTRRAIASVVALIGAGTAVTALAAPADAAPAYTKVWSKVASCESGGDWSIDTGNGYYGGVQFSSSTWAANGGHKYAKQASGASKREQIEVARRVLHSQGPGAWPVCGANAGLTRSNGGATSATLPASDETIEKQNKAAARKKADAAKKAAAVKKADAAKKAAAAKASTTSTTPATTSAATKAEPVTTRPVTTRPVTTRPVTTKPVKAKPVKHVAKHSAKPGKGDTTRYVVKSGDTLSGIVRKLHLDTSWKHLATFNRLSNPDVLHVGQVLHLPKAA